MSRFLIGLAVGAVLVLVVCGCYVRFGYVDPRADQSMSALEMKIAMPALDASVDRRAPNAQNPLQPTDDNLTAGMKIYQSNCAVCHGDVTHAHTALGDSFYPRAPQFAEDAPDMPENQNFYIVQHGVRLSGMPGWKTSLKETEIWQVTTFLSHMDKLPPAVQTAWKSAAGASGVADGNGTGSGQSADAGTKQEKKD